MNFSCDDETRQVKTAFSSKVDTLFGTVFKLNKNDISYLFEGSFLISTLISRLEDYYKDSLDINDIDESIFIRESRVILIHHKKNKFLIKI
jgi:transaldolase